MLAPRIITAQWIGLEFDDVFGELGPARHVTGHFSAGPRAGDWRQAVAVARQFHIDHTDHGWGGCGYHFLIADDGSLLCLRPVALTGAHVGGHNRENVGVCCAGTSGHRPTRAQRDTYAWLLANAHTDALGDEHRTPEDLREAELHVHNQWHGHWTNPCAGWFEEMFLAGTDQPERGASVDTARGERIKSAGYMRAVQMGAVVADGRHVTMLEAHQAGSDRSRIVRVDQERLGEGRPGTGRTARAIS